MGVYEEAQALSQIELEEEFGHKEKDMVNNPDHYNLNHKGIECIDAIEAMLTPEEFRGYLRGNSFKYRWRYRYKNNPIQDLSKAEWYEKRLLELEKKEQ